MGAGKKKKCKEREENSSWREGNPTAKKNGYGRGSTAKKKRNKTKPEDTSSLAHQGRVRREKKTRSSAAVCRGRELKKRHTTSKKKGR